MARGSDGGIDLELLARALADVIPELSELYAEHRAAAAAVAWSIYAFFLDRETQERVRRRYGELLLGLPRDEEQNP